MVSFFASGLLIFIAFITNQSYTEQDTILDAHEFYYYSQMVDSWGNPPDSLKILTDVKNLQLMICVFSLEKDSSIFWKYPPSFVPKKYYSYSDSELMNDLWDVDIPLYVSSGEMGGLPVIYVENGLYRYVLALEYEEPSDFLIRFLPASAFTILFCFILFFFIKRFLYPIKLMRKRVSDLEKGDLDSKIKIKNFDELGLLSITINKMISNIQSLLNQKQRLLSEVSHELMSPLTRIKLLLEFFPEHKNKNRLKNEISNLKNIISNLLLSDKLDAPYSKLNLTSVSFSFFLDKLIAKFWNYENKISVVDSFPETNLIIDSVKVEIAIKNILENAVKHSGTTKPIKISSSIENGFLSIVIQDFGVGIKQSNLDKIMLPFYKGKNKSSGLGLGLSISKKIILAHKGKLFVSSELNKGSIFKILLPI